MANPVIEVALDAQNEASDPVFGGELLGGAQNIGPSTAIGLQVIYAPGTTTGNFTVVFEAGFDRNGSGAITYGTVATITQAEVNNPVTLTIVRNMVYRFRQTSTGTVDIIAMAG